MATSTVPKSLPFLVFPTLSPEYVWKVVATETGRTVSRHRLLEIAVRKAEQLNVRAITAEMPILPEPVYALRESYQEKDERGSCQLWYEFGSDRADMQPCDGIGSITDPDSGYTYCLDCWKVNRG